MEIFDQILSMSAVASIVMAAVFLARLLIKRFPRKYAYLLWLIVGIRLVCPVAASSSLSLFNLRLLPEADVAEKTISGQQSMSGEMTKKTATAENREGDNKMVSKVQRSGMAEGMAQKEPGEIASEPSTQEPEKPSTISKVLSVLVFVWLAGMVLLLLWNLFLTIHMRQRLRKAVLYRDNIYECDGIASPFVFGLLHPRIYIPFHLAEGEREYILRHEQYHIKRRDYIIKMIAFLILTVYWFHPLVWISYFCMVRDMEMSCDEYVLTSMGIDIRKEYSRSLLAFATNQRHLSMELLAFGETDTRKRIRHILNFREKRKWMGILAGIVVLVVAAVCLTNGKTEGSRKEGGMISGLTELSGTDIIPAENMDPVRIGFWRPEDEAVEPSYYEDTEKLERLRKLAEELDPDHGYTKAVQKKWQKEKQTGCVLSYKGNVWEVYTGGYVCFLYGKDEKEDPEQNAMMYLPELCREVEHICKTELDYQRMEPSKIKDVVSAELSYKKKDGTYQKQTLRKKAKLEILEDVLSKAKDMGRASACPFGTVVLTLQLQSGKAIQLTWADDSCRVIRINGIYYEYEDRFLNFSPDGIRALFDQVPLRGLEK